MTESEILKRIHEMAALGERPNKVSVSPQVCRYWISELPLLQCKRASEQMRRGLERNSVTR